MVGAAHLSSRPPVMAAVRRPRLRGDRPWARTMFTSKRRIPSGSITEGQLATVEVEVLDGEVVYVGQGHEILEERVPPRRVVHTASELGVRLVVEPSVQRGDHA